MEPIIETREETVKELREFIRSLNFWQIVNCTYLVIDNINGVGFMLCCPCQLDKLDDKHKVKLKKGKLWWTNHQKKVAKTKCLLLNIHETKTK